jgi:hypothetical protein
MPDVNKSAEELQHKIMYDSKGKLLEGGKRYKLTLPSNIPASDFWSIIVYDSDSRLIIHTNQPWSSVFSENKRKRLKKSIYLKRKKQIKSK